MTANSETRAGRLASALDGFVRSSPEVVAAAVVSFDGLPMATALPPDMEEDRLGAMSAALLSLGEQATLGLGRGQLNQVFVEGEHGFVFLMSADDQAVLAAVATREAKIGFMLYEMRRAATQVGAALRSPIRTEVAHDPAPAPAAPAPTSAPQGTSSPTPRSEDPRWSGDDGVMTIPDDVGSLFGDHGGRGGHGTRSARQR